MKSNEPDEDFCIEETLDQEIEEYEVDEIIEEEAEEDLLKE